MTDQKVEEKAVVKIKKVSNRRKYRIDSWTDEQVAARLKELQVPSVPEGWLKFSEVGAILREQKLPVSALVKASGGDRGMNPPLDPAFAIVYVGKTRYITPDVLTKGLALLRDPNFARTPHKPRVKKEKIETGPVTSSKLGKTVVSVRPTPTNRPA